MNSSYKTIQGSLILYTSPMKYVAIRTKICEKLGFPNQEISDIDDGYNPILGVARFLVQQVSPLFSPKMLTEVVQLEKEEISKISSPLNWDSVWKNISYNEWLEDLSDCPFFTIPIQNGIVRYVFLRKIDNEDAFLENMNNLQVNTLIFCEEEITLQSQQITEETKRIFNFFSEELNSANQIKNLQSMIQNKENLIQSQNSRQNTVILISNQTFVGPQQLGNDLRNGIPRTPVIALYKGFFRSQDEKWLQYNAPTGIFPEDEVILNAKAIVLTGSPYSTYDLDPWIKEYQTWLYRVYKHFPHIKILGICYGEQILSVSFGGECSKTSQRIQNPLFYNFHVEKISLTEQFMNLPFVKRLELQGNQFLIQKAHGDVVTKIDKNELQLAGSSEKHEIEVVVDQLNDSCRLLAIQGHPEYTNEWKLRKNSQMEAYKTGKEVEEILRVSKETFHSDKPSDHSIFKDICISFLNS